MGQLSPAMSMPLPFHLAYAHAERIDEVERIKLGVTGP